MNSQRVLACERPVARTAPVSIRLRHRSVGSRQAAAVPPAGCRKGALDPPPGGARLCGTSADTHLVVEALLATHRYPLTPPPGPPRFFGLDQRADSIASTMRSAASPSP